MGATPGIDAGRLRRIIAAIEYDVETGFYDGAQIAVGRGGELLLHEAVGYADRGASRKLGKDALDGQQLRLRSHGKHVHCIP